MVTTPLYGRTILFIFILTTLALFLSSCSEQDGPQDKTGRAGSGSAADTAATNSGVSATDTAGARPVEVRPESIAMSYAVKPGDVFSYRITKRSRVTEGNNGVEGLEVYYYTKRITSVVPDSQITFTFRFDRIVVTTAMQVPDSTGRQATRQLRYNSADTNDRKNPEFAQYSVLIGHDVVIVVDPRGKILDIRNVEPVANKLISLMERDSVSAEERRFITNSIAANTYGLVHTQEFQIYPEKALDSTRSWKNTISAPLLGIFPTENVVTYRLEKVLDMKGRRVAEISGSLSSRVLKRQEANPYGTLTLKSGGIQGASKHLVDLEKGFTVFKKSSLRVDAEVSAVRSDSQKTETTKQQTTTDFIVELL